MKVFPETRYMCALYLRSADGLLVSREYHPPNGQCFYTDMA